MKAPEFLMIAIILRAMLRIRAKTTRAGNLSIPAPCLLIDAEASDIISTLP